MKRFCDVLWFPLLFFFGFLTCYLLAFHAPAPHGTKVAVAGPVSVTQIGTVLQRQEASGAFDLIPVADAGQAPAGARLGGRAAYIVGSTLFRDRVAAVDATAVARRSILTKLGARSQLEAVAKAREWGFRG